jgi:hypothetical protein
MMGVALLKSVVGASIISAGLALSASAAQAQAVYVRGNDTGGIISWSCEAEAAAKAIAAEHCAWHNKYARITSVHRQYGDYIAFQCLWAPNIARFQLPAVRTRSSCAANARSVRVRALY